MKKVFKFSVILWAFFISIASSVCIAESYYYLVEGLMGNNDGSHKVWGLMIIEESATPENGFEQLITEKKNLYDNFFIKSAVLLDDSTDPPKVFSGHGSIGIEFIYNPYLGDYEEGLSWELHLAEREIQSLVEGDICFYDKNGQLLPFKDYDTLPDRIDLNNGYFFEYSSYKYADIYLKLTKIGFFEKPEIACDLDPKFVKATLGEGIKYYTDRDYTLTSVPSQYLGMNMIKTPNDERNKTDGTDYMTFELIEPSTVYVAFDGRATHLPSWMSGFTDTTERIYTSLTTQPYLKIFQKSYQAGCVNFGANKAPEFSGGTVSNYIVFYGTGSAPPPPLCILDSKFQETTLSQGIKYYTDRDYTLTNVPSQYVGMDLIKTPNDERNKTDENDYITFELNEPANVYVAIDGRTTSLPGWMTGFTDTTNRIYTSLDTQPYLKVYQKFYSTGGCVNFGANKAPGFSGGTVSNYIVFR